MIGKPIVPLEQANHDVDEALEYCLKEASDEVALGFIDALGKAYTHISRHPASGSTRYLVELNLPGLRSWPVRRFPHIVFYVEATDHVDVWRVLHGTRDIPEWMQGPGANRPRSRTPSTSRGSALRSGAPTRHSSGTRKRSADEGMPCLRY